VALTRGFMICGLTLALAGLIEGYADMTARPHRAPGGGALGAAAGVGIAAVRGGSLLADGAIGAAGGAVIGTPAPGLGS
jgi:hypothetical protein